MDQENPKPKGSDASKSNRLQRRKLKPDDERSSVESGQSFDSLNSLSIFATPDNTTPWGSVKTSKESMKNLNAGSVEDQDSSIRMRGELLRNLLECPSISNISSESTDEEENAIYERNKLKKPKILIDSSGSETTQSEVKNDDDVKKNDVKKEKSSQTDENGNKNLENKTEKSKKSRFEEGAEEPSSQTDENKRKQNPKEEPNT